MTKLTLTKIACMLSAFCAATAISLPAQVFTTLASFDSPSGVATPEASLVQGLDGNLYGTTDGGGSSDSCSFGCGTVFKMTPQGALTTLYSFCAQPACTDGVNPVAALVLGTDGNFYGTTYGGGSNGEGTVFKITPAGVLTTLHSFLRSDDGANPRGALILATDGNFYGTTLTGGPSGFGTVFEITPAGELTTVHSFQYFTDGEQPYAGVTQATNDDFYGTNYQGGNTEDGTIFKMTPGGSTTTLYAFGNRCARNHCPTGSYPRGALLQAADGNFYGTTSAGGSNDYGTVFLINSASQLIVLHSFAYVDGAVPYAGLIQATDGAFYGTTNEGGANGDDGTIFKMTPAGTLTSIHSFDYYTDGATPHAALVQATNGTFYGTASTGGAYEQGTAFSVSIGLGPFAETIPTAGKVGLHVVILGANLTGTTSVTFNGMSATFKIESDTEITTTVPRGATTGTVEVKTPTGTLKSNIAFRVIS